MRAIARDNRFMLSVLGFTELFAFGIELTLTNRDEINSQCPTFSAIASSLMVTTVGLRLPRFLKSDILYRFPSTYLKRVSKQMLELYQPVPVPNPAD